VVRLLARLHIYNAQKTWPVQSIFLQAVSAVFNLAGPVGRAFDYLLSPKIDGCKGSEFKLLFQVNCFNKTIPIENALVLFFHQIQ